MKTLLLDIDNTLMDGMVARPYLKEFIERMLQKYKVRFFTAANRKRVTDVCRFLANEQMDPRTIRDLQRYSLSRENCKQEWYHIPEGGVIEIKCLDKASQVLGIPREDILLLDDAPSYHHPHAGQIIQAEGFMAYDVDEDEYLKDLDI